MRLWRLLLVGGVVLASACGKSEKPAPETHVGQARGADTSVTVDNAPFVHEITAKGYRVVQARRFPAQLSGRRGTVVVYRSSDGKGGGILYTQRMGDEPDHVSWHWMFRDGAPDSILPAELNNDGLWDVRVFMQGGKVTEFIQGRDFTFLGPEREGLLALNGDSSAPGDVWKCLDGDTATAWRAPSGGAFIEFSNPFGLQTGELSVKLAGKDRPKGFVLVAGGARESIDLEKTSSEQRFRLDAAIKDAPSIRIEVQGAGPNVAISEMEIR